MDIIDVTAIEIRDYAIGLGWKLVSEAVKDGYFVLNSPNGDDTQLIFPKETPDSRFLDSAWTAIRRLSDTHSYSIDDVIQNIREVNDDVFTIRYFSEVKKVNSLLFENALKAIEATRQLILSAASSIIHPSSYHPKLNRVEPQELIKKVKFRHTREGSFVLKVSCPVDVNTISLGLFGEEYFPSLGRKTFSLINSAACEMLDAIESNQESEFALSQLQAVSPIISYNFCEALSDIYDENLSLPFDLGFIWSKRTAGKIPEPSLPSTLRYQYEFKDKIDDIKVILKKEPQKIDDTFIATVESLNGDIGEDGQRAGEVRLNILLGSSIVSAKTILNADQYAEADKAHMHPGNYIRVTGSLHPAKQLRLLDNITQFQVI